MRIILKKAQMIFLPVLAIVFLLGGCAQAEQDNGSAAPETSGATNEISPDLQSGGQSDEDVDDAGSGPEAEPNATDEQPDAQNIEEPLAVSIVSFTSDEQVYGSSDKMVFSIVINSSAAVENASISIHGIKPYRRAYVDDTKTAALDFGTNSINFTETAPYCTSGCGGVYPGPYEINAQVFVDDVIVANSSITVNLVSESSATRASDFI